MVGDYIPMVVYRRNEIGQTMTTDLARKGKRRGTLDDELYFQIKACGLPLPQREFRFDCGRKWRFDLAWPGPNPLACEAEGGIFVNGRHVRGLSFEKDCEKYNAATLLGWRILRFTGSMIKDGRAINAIEKALGALK